MYALKICCISSSAQNCAWLWLRPEA